MTASQLHDHLVRTLMRKAGGTLRRWRTVVGPVRVHDPATHVHCNWSVTPTGTSREIAEVERLLDVVRLEHPIITAG
ncbi:MAG: hypothetical protein KYX69_12080 [Sphingomonas sp.]|uniref:hypothetical protein n=1 Tax=Sphingomonas sp. TaxID=28214 RepID=UPI00261C44FE|nr:hypothetical protein [Sphingomonas sp.]MDK2768442.1 hypothetical protein [Sphingomonas sp.]